MVGGVAVEGVGDGRCGVVGGWAGGFTLHAVCVAVCVHAVMLSSSTQSTLHPTIEKVCCKGHLGGMGI